MNTYSARTAYLPDHVATGYEADRFERPVGRYRLRCEQTAVRGVLGDLPRGLSVLDSPCGTGRWLPVLAAHADELCGLDVSPAMLRAARQRSEADADGLDPVLVIGEAEHLPFPADRFDLAFSHALTKHLPLPVQHRALAELGRVSRRWVVCSFSVVGPVTYGIWRRRRPPGSYPLLVEQLDQMAAAAGLLRRRMVRCSTPIGVEHCVLLERVGGAT